MLLLVSSLCVLEIRLGNQIFISFEEYTFPFVNHRDFVLDGQFFTHVFGKFVYLPTPLYGLRVFTFSDALNLHFSGHFLGHFHLGLFSECHENALGKPAFSFFLVYVFPFP